MLKLITIQNFAVVERATIELTEGLNLLTGETGSGKSIFVDALGLLLGGRASADIVRGGHSAAFIEGVFAVEQNPGVERLAREAGIDVSDGELIVRREVSDKARSRAFVNDRLVTMALLRELRPYLLDIHGQGDQQTLMDPEAHIDLLDEFAGLGEMRQQVEDAYLAYSAARRDLTSLEQSEAERLRTLDVLAFQIDEIGRAGLQVGEDESLARERALLVNAERIAQLTNETYAVLYEDEASVLPALSLIERKLDQLVRVDPAFDSHLDQVKNARYTLEDLAYFLRDYRQNIDFSADRLQVLDERLDEINRLKRKYGATVSDILVLLGQLKAQHDGLASYEERANSLTVDVSMRRAEYLKVASQLSDLRALAARDLENRVMRELADLAMGETVFVVEIEANPQSASAGGRGIDRVEFFVATNPGEEPRPLVRIASGGEISRLMLALKTVSAPPEIPRTLVFDEVDVGIGGRVAETIGQRLWDLSRGNQVLCVTHQVQIARFADTHFSVRKAIVDDRAIADVVKLDRKGQVEELARMIGGLDATETAKRHARELLKVR